MAWLAWVGAVLALAGIVTLGRLALDARAVARSALEGEALRRRLARLAALNAAGLALGFLGLALVVLGALL